MTDHRDLIAQLTLASINAGITQREISRRAGTDHSTVSRWERQQRTPMLDTFCRLAAAAGFSVVLVPLETSDAASGQKNGVSVAIMEDGT